MPANDPEECEVALLKVLTMLAANYQDDLSEERIAFYVKVLKGKPADALFEAMRHIVMHETFMPRPNVLLYEVQLAQDRLRPVIGYKPRIRHRQTDEECTAAQKEFRSVRAEYGV